MNPGRIIVGFLVIVVPLAAAVFALISLAAFGLRKLPPPPGPWTRVPPPKKPRTTPKRNSRTRRGGSGGGPGDGPPT